MTINTDQEFGEVSSFKKKKTPKKQTKHTFLVQVMIIHHQRTMAQLKVWWEVEG